MAGFVVALDEPEPGVLDFPTVPEVTALMREGVEDGVRSNASRQYLTPGSGAIVGFAVDLREAARFNTVQEAQAAIQAIPAHIRPNGLSVVPVD